MIVDRYKIFPYVKIAKIYRYLDARLNYDYSDSISQEDLEYFGKPLELNKKFTKYDTSPNFEFMRGGLSVDKYFYGDSIKGTTKYFKNELHLKKRAENIKNNPRTIEKTLTDILGIGSVPLGAITNHEKSIIHKENGNKTIMKINNFKPNVGLKDEIFSESFLIKF